MRQRTFRKSPGDTMSLRAEPAAASRTAVLSDQGPSFFTTPPHLACVSQELSGDQKRGQHQRGQWDGRKQGWIWARLGFAWSLDPPILLASPVGGHCIQSPTTGSLCASPVILRSLLTLSCRAAIFPGVPSTTLPLAAFFPPAEQRLGSQRQVCSGVLSLVMESGCVSFLLPGK